MCINILMDLDSYDIQSSIHSIIIQKQIFHLIIKKQKESSNIFTFKEQEFLLLLFSFDKKR